jgi:hypothetical protein
MSDIKPKRAAREPARSEASADHVIAAATASVIEQNMKAEPDPVSTTVAAPASSAVPAPPAVAGAGGWVSDEALKTSQTNAEVLENAWSALAEAQCALARGFERAAVEATGISRSGMVATADAAVALLGARTFAEALEINAGLARRGIDAMLEGSARISEIGAKAIADASRPLLSRFGRNWSALGSG